MKLRRTSLIVCLVYLAVAMVVGMVHHHASEGTLHGHHHCFACEWQVAGTSDVPVVDTPVPIGHSIAIAVLPVETVFVPNPYLSLSRNRAPPVAPA